ncbi:unnamed protein product [Rotaria sp. Silwood1]|nr:unnamed protein product [Rotaria sp. Silwood1]CAF0949947.1 unnamed protein product [Rotaria sp. Silwood1]CAF3376792.1 unnamed protein product [Rotaria sp. Silwood1]CAF3400767.1 unnamed protein product [Rotaria sp. Silwood1]CAF4894513.1 unnamed protein product [Rotaria sp. Silwood1]
MRIKLNRFISDSAAGFLSIDNCILEKNENSSNQQPSSDDVLVLQNGEVRITVEGKSIISPTRKMHPIKAWYHQTMPDYITCHQIWLIIHVLVTITLCVLYLTHIIQISGGTIAVCELFFGVLVRNEIFIASLHLLVALTPCFKYEFNRMLHCIGGLHVSSAFAAFFWLLISLICERHGSGVRITGGIILFLILCISSTAMPIVRRRFHNTFERIHRYIGWTSLFILIVHVIFIQLDNFNSFSTKALFNVPVLILLVIIIIILLPWICIRKVLVQYDQPSKDLTILTFPRAIYPYGSFTRISLDGYEWHAFAIALSDPCMDQHSVLVAAAGDWTKTLADDYRNNKLPQYVWIRQIKGLGFMYSIHAYRRVLIVCTGSGIAPALPYIKDPLPTTHTHLLWIAKKHEEIYGEYIWKLVQKLHPHYTLHDTSVNGRPGPQLVEDQFWKTNSEAVFVVSNEKFTIEVINALWRKDIPCFGALFDS